MLRRSEWMKLHETVTATDPQTGRTKKTLRYIGKRYRLDALEARRTLVRAAVLTALALAAFLLPGLTRARASQCVYVLPPYMLCALPLFYLLMALARLARAGSELTEIDLTDGLRSGRRSAVGLTALGALWTAGCAVFLLTGGAPFNWAEAAFLVGGAAVALCGAFIGRLLRSLHPEELT